MQYCHCLLYWPGIIHAILGGGTIEAILRSWWEKIKIHPVRAILIAFLAVVIVLIILSILGYIFNWGWTGLGPYISPPHPNDSDFQRGKTLWDWLQLLIIPAVLAVAGYLINLTISRSEGDASDKRAKTEREIAQDNQRESAFQTYLDRMSELLLKEHLGELPSDGMLNPEYEGVRKIARVRTLRVLPLLDNERKRNVIQFLYESSLINKENTIIHLNEADLRNASLDEAQLKEANLSEAKLMGADLSRANLEGANLHEARYNTKTIHSKDALGNPLTLEATKWPEGYDENKLRERGAICDDCK
jgi:hypothetical protein